jgi:hypothetical protein
VGVSGSEAKINKEVREVTPKFARSSDKMGSGEFGTFNGGSTGPNIESGDVRSLGTVLSHGK